MRPNAIAMTPPRWVAALLTTLLLVGSWTIVASSPAQAATAAASPDCQVVLDRLHPGEHESRVLLKQCARPGERLAAPTLTSATVLIMTWYEHIRYGGASTRIYGVYGPCDSAGYGIHQFDSFWNDRVSSFKVWNNCNYTRGYLNKDYGGTPCGRWYGSVDWVGWTFNDKLSSFWVASVSRGC